MPFAFYSGALPGLVMIEPRLFTDDRGFFLEVHKASDFEKAGIRERFVQDNHSCSMKGVVRGLHFQRAPYAQGKLVRVTRGTAWDVAVDLRVDSPSYGKWSAIELSESNRFMLYIPQGFAHGFQALEDNTELLYKCTTEYDASSDGGVRWNDPDIGIEWPLSEVIVSAKDAALPFLKELA